MPMRATDSAFVGLRRALSDQLRLMGRRMVLAILDRFSGYLLPVRHGDGDEDGVEHGV